MHSDVDNIVGDIASENPFEVTKATDFTDHEINETWVDWPAPGGFATFLNVHSQTPRIFLGGKGVGRTHFMRRFSAPSQSIRGGKNPLEQVVNDGVLGIHVNCSGLNSDRFQGRGQSEEVWRSVFPQFADAWLAQAALQAFETVTKSNPPTLKDQSAIIRDVGELFHNRDLQIQGSLADLTHFFYRIQQRIDLAVNNAVLNPGEPLKVKMLFNPGALVFGVPRALRQHYPPLGDTTFLYLIDEFENFERLHQQQYVNSLIREREIGTSFVIGVRNYGLKTLSTLSGGEENRRGAEFVELRPDVDYIGPEKSKFGDFCRGVVKQRLSMHSILEDVEPVSVDEVLSGFFEVPSHDYEEKLVIEHFKIRERAYLSRLRTDLTRNPGTGLSNPESINFIVDAVRVDSRPLLEKINVFMIYRAWSRGENLIESAQKIVDSRPSSDPDGIIQPNAEQKTILDHYVTDMKAQLYIDMRSRPTYAGLDQFITIADGQPRNLIVILRNIYRWSLFNGERPFRGGLISVESQRRGVLEASNWFYADAKPLGQDGADAHAAIHRLCEMFRRFRYSDKPVESSLASFSTDLTSCSDRASELVDLAEKWGMLIRVKEGQKNRNTGVVEPKFQLNRLLSPRWDLPIARRGAVSLSAEEVNGIFDPSQQNEFTRILSRRLERMNVPFRQRDSETVSQGRLDWKDGIGA